LSCSKGENRPINEKLDGVWDVQSVQEEYLAEKDLRLDNLTFKFYNMTAASRNMK
tara:strand:+ start:90 stop:254 length:165 start_codon:yes stop_codon:yes gene_type:complete